MYTKHLNPDEHTFRANNDKLELEEHTSHPHTHTHTHLILTHTHNARSDQLKTLQLVNIYPAGENQGMSYILKTFRFMVVGSYIRVQRVSGASP